MLKKIIILSTVILLLAGCNRLRIRDLDEEPEVLPDIIETSQFNYQRNALSPEGLQPPVELEWEESYMSLPNRGFSTISKWMFFGTYNGYLAAADMTNGSLIGRRNLGDGCGAPPSIYRNLLFQSYEVGSSGLVAYDIVEGGVIWELPGYLGSAAPIIIDSRIIHISSNGMIFCLNYLTGAPIWQKSAGHNFRNSSAMYENLIITAAMNGSVTAFDITSGVNAWQQNLGAPYWADPVVQGDHIFLVNYAGSLTVLKARSGQPVNRREFNMNLYHGPTVSEENVYLATSDGSLWILDRQTLEPLHVHRGEGPASSPPLVSGDYIYYATLEKKLYILDRSDGKPLQVIEFEGRPRSTPLIRDKRLIITCEDDRVLSFRQPE